MILELDRLPQFLLQAGPDGLEQVDREADPLVLLVDEAKGTEVLRVPAVPPGAIFWAYLKSNPLANFAAVDAAHLARVATRHVQRLGRRPKLLRSFFEATPLFFLVDKTLLIQVSISAKNTQDIVADSWRVSIDKAYLNRWDAR